MNQEVEVDEVRQAHEDIAQLIGETLLSVVRYMGGDGDEVLFESVTGDRWRMYHGQVCCEAVGIDDVVGDLSDLVGAPIAMAEVIENSNSGSLPKKDSGGVDHESYTWTFFKFATTKGYVTIRWYGAGNGYYSETASFVRMK